MLHVILRIRVNLVFMQWCVLDLQSANKKTLMVAVGSDTVVIPSPVAPKYQTIETFFFFFYLFHNSYGAGDPLNPCKWASSQLWVR